MEMGVRIGEWRAHVAAWCRRRLSGALLWVPVVALAAPSLSSLSFGSSLALIGGGLLWRASREAEPSSLSAVSGVYAWFRHPVPVGRFLVVVGGAVASANAGVLALTMLVAGILAFRSCAKDDTRRVARGGAWYREYMQMVPAVLPRVPLSVLNTLLTGAHQLPPFQPAGGRGQRGLFQMMALGGFLSLVVLYFLPDPRPWNGIMAGGLALFGIQIRSENEFR